ncbi:hypothetical protein DRJ22_05905 [Candidatus Woesearchaeota archaeon]|nr:MAG: hypothetical protein B6U93_03260 [Candidatus Woesearchaeota archaeon ex4484_78]RLE44487.1 MAG: hypothetical protein DRJ22_05905 [Candidatus Woesearchaeota archaeon]
MEKPITARCIIDMLGAPKEHIENKLKEHTEMLKKNGFEILREEHAEAKQKEGDKLYTAFSELEIRFKNPQELLDFCFESMPSSVEILDPEDKIEIDTRDFTAFINDFQAKLHHTDMTLKQVELQKKILDMNAINILHNFIVYILKREPKTLEELTKTLGIREKELSKFLTGLEQKKVIKKEGDKYTCTI